MRCIRSEKALASFKHHIGPITTVEWSPFDPAVFATGGEDNQIALFDLSVEKAEEPLTDDIKVCTLLYILKKLFHTNYAF